MTDNSIIIRRIQNDEETRGKGYVHWRGWMDTYRGLIPYTYLETFTLEKCEKMALEFRDNTFIALDGDKVVGFSGYGSGRGDYLPPDGEIVGLYVLKEYQGKGIGYRLMQETLKELRNYPRVSLWVLQGNDRAIDFYQQCGFRFDGIQQVLNLSQPVIELHMVYEWPKEER